MTAPKVACLLGPTASGKTAAALAFAQRFPVEIISVDSALVYRGMDIGTAKPTEEERAIAPHHLIDIIDPTGAYSAAQFRNDALRLVAEIEARGRIPLLVGGTMLYYMALTRGLNELPEANTEVRAALDEEAMRDGWPALHARLAVVDPETAARLAPNDSQRIQRALEVFMLSGRALSAILKDPKKSQDGQPEFVPIALEPSNRSVLHRRIEKRFDSMLDSGFLNEVKRLRARGDLSPAMPSMRCVGYRQAWEYLDGLVDYTTMRDKGVFATRQLCKRQLTWLRGIEGRRVVDCARDNATAMAVDEIERMLRI
ncbi:tRNA dimethylallyltransferase [Burkholderia sp. PAMC 28687]|uniref:tRNA dimethylallyltransferase n=2 Tax=Caballeronia TaxID=1827195 RepID=A0A242N947_CABSO|nr:MULTISPECIES: tRNA (adenosine(37)-N6)-dimethylallyltransferase MiaA [Burkholderiaceae]AMM14830.1 tRNA dimethylallyltransferase [Burkholderia sp. PAMC 28687]OTP80189.1 tRNA dimethylallyltransferase [Caballeronia sordidicola]